MAFFEAIPRLYESLLISLQTTGPKVTKSGFTDQFSPLGAVCRSEKLGREK
jgi:hypothetical protein